MGHATFSHLYQMQLTIFCVHYHLHAYAHIKVSSRIFICNELACSISKRICTIEEEEQEDIIILFMSLLSLLFALLSSIEDKKCYCFIIIALVINKFAPIIITITTCYYAICFILLHIIIIIIIIILSQVCSTIISPTPLLSSLIAHRSLHDCKSASMFNVLLLLLHSLFHSEQ